jgi:hypothetical protein
LPEDLSELLLPYTQNNYQGIQLPADLFSDESTNLDALTAEIPPWVKELYSKDGKGKKKLTPQEKALVAKMEKVRRN